MAESLEPKATQIHDDVEQLEEIGETKSADDSQKSTAYAGDFVSNSHHKTGLERRLVWKTDLLLVPLIAMQYFASFLDRNSIGNARIMGLQKDLGMSDQDYNNCAQMFYVGYVLFMLPGNVLLRYMTPHVQIGIAIVTFGTLLCGMSAAQNTATVLALRILIGSAQAFIQGIGLYTSLWYRRDEIATRGAIYFSASTLSGAFSGLISYGIQSNLTLKVTGKESWRWLFIIEGVLGIVVGILTYLMLPRFPDKMKGGKNWYFSKEEINLAIARAASWNTKDSKTSVLQMWVALKDPKSWAFAFISGSFGLCVSSVGVFLPTFVVDFGYTSVNAQLFSVIPYACAFVALPTVAIISDRVNKKGPFVILAQSVACIGYIILLTDAPTSAKMVATCLVASGIYTGVVLVVTWLGINTGGFTKRATTWAMAEILAQCFSIMAVNVYKGGPRYIQGHAIALSFLVTSMLLAFALLWWMNSQNKKRNRIVAEYAERGELHPHLEKSLEEEYDYHIIFRYIL